MTTVDFDQPSNQFHSRETIFSEQEAGLILTKLTLREREILYCIVAGLTNREISRKLYLSQRTVENHRLKLTEKTNLKTVSALLSLVYLGGYKCLPYCIYKRRCLNFKNSCPLTEYRN